MYSDKKNSMFCKCICSYDAFLWLKMRFSFGVNVYVFITIFLFKYLKKGISKNIVLDILRFVWMLFYG